MLGFDVCTSSRNEKQVSSTDNGVEVHEHMWSNEVFTAYVDEVAGEGCWRKKMQPRMEQIVKWSLLCAQVRGNIIALNEAYRNNAGSEVGRESGYVHRFPLFPWCSFFRAFL